MVEAIITGRTETVRCKEVKVAVCRRPVVGDMMVGVENWSCSWTRNLLEMYRIVEVCMYCIIVRWRNTMVLSLECM